MSSFLQILHTPPIGADATRAISALTALVGVLKKAGRSGVLSDSVLPAASSKIAGFAKDLGQQLLRSCQRFRTQIRKKQILHDRPHPKEIKLHRTLAGLGTNNLIEMVLENKELPTAARCELLNLSYLSFAELTSDHIERLIRIAIHPQESPKLRYALLNWLIEHRPKSYHFTNKQIATLCEILDHRPVVTLISLKTIELLNTELEHRYVLDGFLYWNEPKNEQPEAVRHRIQQYLDDVSPQDFMAFLLKPQHPSTIKSALSYHLKKIEAALFDRTIDPQSRYGLWQVILNHASDDQVAQIILNASQTMAIQMSFMQQSIIDVEAPPVVKNPLAVAMNAETPAELRVFIEPDPLLPEILSSLSEVMSNRPGMQKVYTDILGGSLFVPRITGEV